MNDPVPGKRLSDERSPSGEGERQESQAQSTADTQRIARPVLLAFSGRAFFGGSMALLTAVYLGKYYLDVMLLPAGLLALGMAISRAFDALTDPVMGYISDYTATRWGRRKPWIVIGVLGNAVMFYLLFVPGVAPATSAVVVWFFVCHALSYLFVTISHIPRQALGKELTFNAQERIRLFGTASLFEAFGVLIGALVPAVLAMGLGITDMATQMQLLAPIFAIGYLATNLWLVYRVPERAHAAPTRRPALIPSIRQIFDNRPFWLLFLAKVVKAIPAALPAALAPFFLQYVLGVSEDKLLVWTGILILIYFGTGFLALPIWMRLATRWGKKKTFMVASALGVVGNGLTFFAGSGDLVFVMCVGVLVGAQLHVWFMLLRAMQADVIDYDELLTGERREGLYVSLWEIIPKFAVATGTAFGLATLGMSGYEPNAISQSPTVLWALRIMFAVVPAIFDGLAIAIMLGYPLVEPMHARIRALLPAVRAGETIRDPIARRPLAWPARDSQDQRALLGHFSVAELRAYVRSGRIPLSSAALWMLVCGAVAAAGVVAVFALVPDLESDPGPLPTLAIIGAGLGLTGFVFHSVRVLAAIRWQRRPVPRASVRDHLQRSGRASPIPTGEPASRAASDSGLHGP